MTDSDFYQGPQNLCASATVNAQLHCYGQVHCYGLVHCHGQVHCYGQVHCCKVIINSVWSQGINKIKVRPLAQSPPAGAPHWVNSIALARHRLPPASSLLFLSWSKAVLDTAVVAAVVYCNTHDMRWTGCAQLRVLVFFRCSGQLVENSLRLLWYR